METHMLVSLNCFLFLVVMKYAYLSPVASSVAVLHDLIIIFLEVLVFFKEKWRTCLFFFETELVLYTGMA